MIQMTVVPRLVHVIFCLSLVTWSSEKQPLIELSSIEVEYHALYHTTSKLLWLQSLNKELIVPYFFQLCYLITLVSFIFLIILLFMYAIRI